MRLHLGALALVRSATVMASPHIAAVVLTLRGASCAACMNHRSHGMRASHCKGTNILAATAASPSCRTPTPRLNRAPAGGCGRAAHHHAALLRLRPLPEVRQGLPRDWHHGPHHPRCEGVSPVRIPPRPSAAALRL